VEGPDDGSETCVGDHPGIGIFTGVSCIMGIDFGLCGGEAHAGSEPGNHLKILIGMALFDAPITRIR
jgi:hypothetical protein